PRRRRGAPARTTPRRGMRTPRASQAHLRAQQQLIAVAEEPEVNEVAAGDLVLEREAKVRADEPGDGGNGRDHTARVVGHEHPRLQAASPEKGAHQPCDGELVFFAWDEIVGAGIDDAVSESVLVVENVGVENLRRKREGVRGIEEADPEHFVEPEDPAQHVARGETAGGLTRPAGEPIGDGPRDQRLKCRAAPRARRIEDALVPEQRDLVAHDEIDRRVEVRRERTARDLLLVEYEVEGDLRNRSAAGEIDTRDTDSRRGIVVPGHVVSDRNRGLPENRGQKTPAAARIVRCTARPGHLTQEKRWRRRY